ncbi:MAG TPA: hypothetical protein VF338_09115 [Leptolinea sp.]
MENIVKDIIGRLHSRKFRLSAIGLFVVLLCLSSLGLMTTRQWQDLQQSDRYLNASLNSKVTADYSVGQPGKPIAQVGLGIIRDMVRDSQPEPDDLPIRLSAVDTLVESPISGSSLLPGLKETEPKLIIPIVPLSLVASASVPDSISTPEPIVKTPGNPNPQKTKTSKPPKLDNPQQPKPDKPSKPEKPAKK